MQKRNVFRTYKCWYGQLIAYLPWIERMHFTAKFCHGVIKAKVIAYAVIECKRFNFIILFQHLFLIKEMVVPAKTLTEIFYTYMYIIIVYMLSNTKE